MINDKTVSLVIPCRNEAEGIGKLVTRALRVVDEVEVVDNNSTDETALRARLAGAVVVAEKQVDKRGIGYGYALKRGMRTAQGEVVVTMDGDGTYPLEQIKNVVKYLTRENLDMVLCSRFPLIDGQAISWWRQLGVWILNTEVRWLYNYPVKDILSGMWVMNRRAMRSLKLVEGGWNFSPEIKLAAIRNGVLTVGQYHIRHYEREFGQSKQKLMETGVEHLLYIGRKWLEINWTERFAVPLAKLFTE